MKGSVTVRERSSFDTDWRFARYGLQPNGSRIADPGDSPSAAAHDDSAWRGLNIPHDWGIEGPFRYDLDNNTGKRPWRGIGWYRKHFGLGKEDEGKRIFIDFDGAMAYAEVWLNGVSIGGWPYGYSSFRLELTPHVKFGQSNVLAVRLDTERWDSRWYPGAGLYRHVWLVKTHPVHVGHWGVCLTTPWLSDATATVEVQTTLDNQSAAAVTPTLRVDIYELAADGALGAKVSASTELPIDIAVAGSAVATLTAVVANPKWWELASPQRYLARVLITLAGGIVDEYDTPFGFRTLEFTARDGFKLNGRRIEINGVCNHHDLGALGTALNERALERQLELIKQMGGNALRTSHNPPAPELLDFADRMGLLVQVEAFDCWVEGKEPNDYSRIFTEWHEKDLLAMVRRDRNHPSVFMWSTGNEIAEQRWKKLDRVRLIPEGSPYASMSGPELARYLSDIIRKADPTRPVTAGYSMPTAFFDGFEHAVDIVGCNYRLPVYEHFLACHDHQEIPFFGCETAGSMSSRGEYFFPVNRGAAARVNFQVSSFDVDAPPWGDTPDEQFAMLDKFPAVMGEFVWTGFDYLGEPTPYNCDATNLLNFHDPAQRETMSRELAELGKIRVPSRSSYFGIIDLAGFPKDRFYAYQARWCPELPMAHLFPHWNWPERVGQTTPVHLYTSGDEAELFLNGRSLGLRQKGKFDYRMRWDEVTYEPGELKVTVRKNGTPWATDTLRTTGPATSLVLTPDRATIKGDGLDLAFVTVRLADVDGLTVPRSQNLVKFEISGPGEVVAVDNGDPTGCEQFQTLRLKAFNGLCLAIVRGKPGEGHSGQIKLTASSEGLTGGSVVIRTQY